MSIASLLVLLEKGETNATTPQPSLHKALACCETQNKNATFATSVAGAAANDDCVANVAKLETEMQHVKAPPVLGCGAVANVAQKISEAGPNAWFSVLNDDENTDESEAMKIARRAIAMAALTDEQKTKRLADLHRDPGLAAFWLACGRKP